MVVRDTIRNPLVLRMTEAERESLRLERIELRKHDVLGRINEPLRHYIFMEHGLVSVLRTMSDDRTCKIGHIPPPGMVGISSFFLTDRSTANYIVQLPGAGLQVERERLRNIVNCNPDLTSLFKRLGHAAWIISGQTSACNRLHEFEHRLCRWLMIASNAIEADVIPASQTEVARLLGVSRQQMRMVLKKLTAAGLALPAQRRIRLVDKAGIEANTCECYRTIAKQFAYVFTNARQKSDFFMNDANYLSPAVRARHVSFTGD